MTITYRSILTTDEFEQAVDLHQQVWGGTERDAVPLHALKALQHAGGLVLGAFDGDRAIGMTLGFPAMRDGQIMHWSHLTGIIPAYQGRGIGTQLKLHQRQWAIEQGYTIVAWTFDPLQRGNANLNIRRLGGICTIYYPDFYGDLRDNLNQGLPSDRFELHWRVASGRVVQRLRNGPPPPVNDSQIHWALAGQGGLSGEFQPPPSGVTQTLVEIPAELNSLRATRFDSAVRWRLQTRAAFQTLLADGFSVTDFMPVMRQSEIHWGYLLQKQ